MDSEHGSGPPIIKKKKKSDHGHHGGAWKVAYADFVTAMMALFIVLWILSSSEQVQKAVADYFKDPSAFNLGQGKSLIDIGKPSNVSEELAQAIKQKELEKENFTRMGEELLEQMKQDVELNDILDQIKIDFTEEGMRIELVESLSEAFFEIGTASLNPKAFNIIKLIGSKLSTIQNGVSVEGHTDARPFQNTGLGYTNFELSADRANSARRALVFGGLKENQIVEIRGFAANKLKNPNDPYDLLNRRVSIIINYSR